MFRPVLSIMVASILGLIAAGCGDGATEQGATGMMTPDLSARLAGTIPAVAAADQEAFRQSIRGRGIVQETCGYDPEVAVAECTPGRFALNPPPISPDASCVVGLEQSVPVFILCSAGAGDRKFYEIKA